MAHGPKDLESQGFRRIAGALWIKTEPQGNVELADGLQVLRIQRADALTVLEELDKALFGCALDASTPPPATEAEARARLAAVGEIGADGAAAADRYVEQEQVIPLGQDVVGIQSMVGDSEEQRRHDERHGIKARHHLTMLSPADTDWIVSRVRSQIQGRVVVEIGAGVGVLACELAKYAKQVYAIEANLPWSWAFMRHLYGNKPANLTWLVGAAQSMVDVIRADVAIVVTGSDEVGLRELAGRFAPTVIMPWQDWNEGRAIVRWSSMGFSAGTSCQCLYGCVMQGAHGERMPPGSSCQLRAHGVAPAPAADAPIACQTCHGTGKELIDCDGSAGYRACPAGCEKQP